APALKGLRGVLPFGLALSPDEKVLYVACAGINAVAVLETDDGTVRGYLPTGWFPARLAVSGGGETLYVANAKGFGAGPNGGAHFHRDSGVAYIGEITKGVVSILPVPEGGGLGRWTDLVLRNNGFAPSGRGQPARRSINFPVPPPGTPSGRIHHVV